MKRALDCLLVILENPFAEKGYRELRNSYLAAGMTNEAEAIQHLIETTFHAEEVPVNKEPREDD